MVPVCVPDRISPFRRRSCLPIEEFLVVREEFAFRRFFHATHAGSIAVGTIIGLVAGPAGGPAEMTMRGIGGGVCGLVASAMLYLYLISKDLAALQIPDDELNDGEFVLLASPRCMVHYRSGEPLRFWDGIGGKLFLTNEVLEFRAHRGQHAVYRKTIPLGQIDGATPCRILGFIPGGLRVGRVDGGFELFTFGAHGNSPNWAAAIMAAKQAGSMTRRESASA
jgi:hypothetical protein